MTRMKIGRAVVVAVLVLMLAVTPLSAMFRPAYFEASLRASLWDGPPEVVLEDRTGLVSAMVAVDGTTLESADDQVLVLSWLGGCSEQIIWLTFHATGDGYRVEKQTARNGCQLLVGLPRTLILVLRAPVDPATVEFEALEASIR